MKLLFFDDWKLGVLKGDMVVDVSDAVSRVPQLGPHDLINGVIARFRALGPAERQDLLTFLRSL